MCKLFFLTTLNISNGRVYKALLKQIDEGQGVPVPDKRNNHRIFDSGRMQGLVEHIDSFRN